MNDWVLIVKKYTGKHWRRRKHKALTISQAHICGHNTVNRKHNNVKLDNYKHVSMHFTLIYNWQNHSLSHSGLEWMKALVCLQKHPPPHFDQMKCADTLVITQRPWEICFFSCCMLYRMVLFLTCIQPSSETLPHKTMTTKTFLNIQQQWLPLFYTQWVQSEERFALIFKVAALTVSSIVC